MELVLVGVVLLVAVALGVLLQSGLVMLATNFAADNAATFPQALGVVVVSNLVSIGSQIMLELTMTGGSAFFVLPVSLMVWGGAISVICDVRLGQAVFSAILMTVFQCVLTLIFAVSAGAWLATVMQQHSGNFPGL